MKAIEQYFHVVLFILLYKVGLWIKLYSVVIDLRVIRPAILSCGTVYSAVQGDSTF